MGKYEYKKNISNTISKKAIYTFHSLPSKKRKRLLNRYGGIDLRVMVEFFFGVLINYNDLYMVRNSPAGRLCTIYLVR